MAQAYFPRSLLETILPGHLSIPDDETMSRYYPETELRTDGLPFLLSFCHGSGIHDVHTKVNVPDQQEIMCVLPVTYTHGDGSRYLGSYVPVLYLDSLLGVLGGLYFGLRKEFHRGMQHGESAGNSRWWRVENIIDASFEAQVDEDEDKLPQFYEQMFCNPFITVSYPLPLTKMRFYQARVSPTIVRAARQTFYWNYKGETVRNTDSGSAVFTEYSFSMSRPMSNKKFFG